MARVVEVYLGARVRQHVVIFFSEIFVRLRRDDGFNFADGDVFNLRVRHEGTSGDTRAEADNQDRFRIGMQQRGQMPQHSLQAHVLRFGGGFHLTAHVKINGAAFPARPGGRGIHAFRLVQQLPVTGGGRQAAAKADQLPGNGGNAEGEDHSEYECKRRFLRVAEEDHHASHR